MEKRPTEARYKTMSEAPAGSSTLDPAERLVQKWEYPALFRNAFYHSNCLVGKREYSEVVQECSLSLKMSWVIGLMVQQYSENIQEAQSITQIA